MVPTISGIERRGGKETGKDSEKKPLGEKWGAAGTKECRTFV